LFPESSLGDSKKVAAFKHNIEKQGKQFSPGFKLNIDMIDMPNFITKMENSINDRKQDFEENLKAIFTAVK